ncbi:DUF169 domain-containing protein [Telmatobacter bradus]|uniref:DUF169 domain-containing protein n=1 Tax=Telmatobacter bradus TaxID=474953 RepID=UPI003B42DF17
MTMTLTTFCGAMGITTAPVAVYDAPDATPFTPVIPLKQCIFDHYQDFQSGATMILNQSSKGCPGCGHWMLGKGRFPSKDVMISFLTDKEGLRENAQLTEAWLNAHPTFTPQNGNIFIGPIRNELSKYLRTITFFVNPDQLSFLIYAAHYHAHPDDPEPVLASFGSGCGLMYSMFPDLSRPQAMVGATDIAMRPHLPPDILGFTVTVPMLTRLLSLDDGHSFLDKPFLKRLNTARAE